MELGGERQYPNLGCGRALVRRGSVPTVGGRRGHRWPEIEQGGEVAGYHHGARRRTPKPKSWVREGSGSRRVRSAGLRGKGSPVAGDRAGAARWDEALKLSPSICSLEGEIGQTVQGQIVRVMEFGGRVN
jgi:hypothetical protein